MRGFYFFQNHPPHEHVVLYVNLIILLCSVNQKILKMKNTNKSSKQPQPKRSLANFENQAIDADKIKGGLANHPDTVHTGTRGPKA